MNNIEQADGLPMPRRVISIITVSLGVTLAVMDGTIVNVALPSMAEALSISAADSIWIVNSYQLTIIMLLLAMARLTGQTLGATLVALFFGLFDTTAPQVALWTAALVSLLVCLVSLSRLKIKNS